MKINLIRSISDNPPDVTEHNNIAIDQIDGIGNSICPKLNITRRSTIYIIRTIRNFT